MSSVVMSALDRPAAELTVVDVYDIAAVLGQEFERTIDRFGCESLVGVVPKVVRVLELLEKLVSRGAAGHEADDLRRELDRLRQERSDRYEQERRHQKDLEQVEDVWRGEVQDLLAQITQLQAENKKLLVSLSLSEAPIRPEEQQRQEGMSEKERQTMKRLKDLLDKQRDEIRAKDHELAQRNEDVEALQMQQSRLIRINQDLRRRTGVIESQCKALIQQRAEQEAAAQARQQEMELLHMEVTQLRKELRESELEREVAQIEENFPLRSEMTSSTPTKISVELSTATPSPSIKPNSVWEECGGDTDFLGNCFEPRKSPSFLSAPPKRGNKEEASDLDEGTTPLTSSTEAEKETDSTGEQESDTPRFTLQELRDVLQERNELKAEVFLLQEELAYYKSEEFEDDACSFLPPPSPPPSHSASCDQPESGISRLIFTAIMPMVAAGLIADDPTLLPIRRLVSLV